LKLEIWVAEEYFSVIYKYWLIPPLSHLTLPWFHTAQWDSE